MADPDKTEKPTPKRREEARKSGNVAKSTDLSGSVVVLAGLLVLGMTGSSMVQRMADGLHDSLAQTSGRDPVTIGTIGDLLLKSGETAMWCLAPIVGVCAVAGILINLLQVGLRPKTKALKPNFGRLNPKHGFKR